MNLPNNTQAEVQTFVNNIMQYAEPSWLSQFIKTGVCVLLITVSFTGGYITAQKPDVSDQFVIDEHKLLQSMQTEKAAIQPVHFPAIPEIEVVFLEG